MLLHPRRDPRGGLGAARKLPEGAYPGTCRSLSRAEADSRIRAGQRFALRVRSDGERVSFEDALQGPRTGAADDFVIVRSDGVHAYQLAVVVDDADQGIGEVVRGADLASSTPRQILLQRLLGLPTPRYAHVPLVLDSHGRRLAKRDAAERPTPGGNLMAWLASSLGLEREAVRDAHDLVNDFDPALIPRVPVLFDASGG